MSQPTLFLKLDLDTDVGTREGVPNLLRCLSKHQARATFFVSLGPDNTGKAALRVFTRPGFLSKMLRTNAPGMYGMRTLLSGTLLPAPIIGKTCLAELRQIPKEGHEVGLHAWDHVAWHDGLDRWSEAEARAEYERGWNAFQGVFGFAPKAVAAPGWTATPASLALHDEKGLLYASDGRGVSPFLPRMGEKDFRTLQIPTTLPTLDEILGRDGVTRENFASRTLDLLRPDGLNVFGGHSEAEGRGYQAEFDAILAGAKARGYRIEALENVEQGIAPAPRHRLVREEIPGRAGLVAVQKEAL